VVLAGQTIVVGDYNLIGIDRTSGAIRWRFVPTDGYAPGIYLGDAAGGRVYTGSAGGRVYAVDEVTGKKQWSTAVVDGGKTTAYEPVADADIVAVSYTTFAAPATGGVAVIDAATGHLRWRSPFPRPSNPSLNTNTTGSVVVTSDSVIAPAGNGEVIAFDRETGALRWSIPKLGGIPASFGPTEFDIRTVARIENTLFAGSLFGYVVAYSLDTRRELWRYDGSSYGSVSVAMSTDDRTLYVPYLGARLVALNAWNGTERWGIGDAQSPFTWRPFAFGDRVLVASSTSGFFAFPRGGSTALPR
jgi:outer membrane protein assembly factor BamB